MAKKHRILLPVLALLLIGACSRNEEIEQPTSPSGGVEVAILCDNTKEPQAARRYPNLDRRQRLGFDPLGQK